MQEAIDPALVGLGFLIAFLGWHASMSLVRRASSRSGLRRLAWLSASAVPIGFATWSMHLVAFMRAPPPLVGWDAGCTIVSLLMAVLTAWLSLALAGRAHDRRRCALVATVTGVGFCSVFFIDATGLAGVEASVVDAGLVVLAIILGAAASATASWLGRRGSGGLGNAACLALVASLATAMIWISVEATSLAPHIPLSHAFTLPAASLAAGAALCSALLSAIGWLAASFDRRLEQLAERSTRLVRQNEKRLQDILRQLPFGIVVADVATKAVVFSNREADRVLHDLDRPGVHGHGFFPTGEAIGDPLERALRDEETVHRELQFFRRPDGTAVTLEISASPIYDEQRRLVTAIAAFQDVSNRVRAEADLRQAQKMDALGQLTGGIAHDTNNLLTAILGNLDLLEPRLADDQQRVLLRNALSATERGAKLTSQLLGFSRRQSLMPCPVNVNQAVAEMHPLLTSTLGGTIRIECTLKADLWPAFADPTQLELVLLNLSINARDAMPAGGAIHVGTENMVLADPLGPTDPPPGEYVMLSVRDSGTGMDQATLARAFEPFFTTKGPGRGSGLGLSQVLGIAQQLGGGVRIFSDAGHGTTVQLFMPRSLAQVQSRPLASAGPDRTSVLDGKIVLLVDDDQDVRTAARALLAHFGCIVIEEADGRAAVARVAGAERIDMVLIDFAMPGLTGADAAERIRAIRPKLPILLITGYADADHLPGVEGRFATLQKPFRGAQLAELLPTMLLDDDDPTMPADKASVVSFQRVRKAGRDQLAAPLAPFSRRDIG